LFKPIEVKDYTQEPLQNFLFAFRAFAVEYHKKLRQLDNMRNMFKLYPNQLLKEDAVYIYRVSQLDLKDLKESYESFKLEYFKGDFRKLKTIYRKLDFEVEFAACTSFTVRTDIFGNEINDIFNLEDKMLPSIYVNVYPIEGGTNIILSYHQNEGLKYNKYFDQLDSLSTQDLIKHLNFLIIEYTENVFFSPSFIERLTVKQKESLLGSFHSSIFLLEKFDLMTEDNYFNFNLFIQST
jgi:hypothetical protein